MLTDHARLIPGKAFDSRTPWKVIQDALNELPPSQPLSTLTPLRSSMEPIRSMQSNRKTHVMHIANVTPDSFSDGSDRIHGTSGEASKSPALFGKQTYERIIDYVRTGKTSIVDIGGQSSAPGVKEVSADEERDRLLNLIRGLSATRAEKERMDFIISVDTYRASVAEAAILAGADIINDISAGQLDPDMLPTMARLGKTVVLMHMRGTPQTMNSLADYPDGVIPTVAKELLERVAAAEEAGIRRWRIILDPGIGFAKTMHHNLEILRRLDELRDWPGLRGLPWLVGSSRKAFIGKITRVKEPHLRLMGSATAVTAAIQGGADIVRVHDTGDVWEVAAMSDAIWRNRTP